MSDEEVSDLQDDSAYARIEEVICDDIEESGESDRPVIEVKMAIELYFGRLQRDCYSCEPDIKPWIHEEDRCRCGLYPAFVQRWLCLPCFFNEAATIFRKPQTAVVPLAGVKRNTSLEEVLRTWEKQGVRPLELVDTRDGYIWVSPYQVAYTDLC